MTPLLQVSEVTAGYGRAQAGDAAAYVAVGLCGREETRREKRGRRQSDHAPISLGFRMPALPAPGNGPAR